MTSFVEEFIAQASYMAVFLLMLLENIFPPLPSEIILSISGIAAARNEMHPALAVLSATMGSLAGAYFWYWIGRLVGREGMLKWVNRYGEWIGLSEKSYQKSLQFFERHSAVAVFWGRIVPTFRTFISIPPGIAGMKLITFLAYSFVGTLMWSSFVFLIAYYFGNKYQSTFDIVGKVFNFIFLTLLLLYIIQILKSRIRR